MQNEIKEMTKEMYQLTKRELLNKYGNECGLSEEQAKEILKENGENQLIDKKRKSIFMIFVEQFADLLVIILIVSGIISMLSGNVESTIVIFAVIILNAILGTVQYLKAEKSLDSLKELSFPHAKVYRSGVKKEILSKEVVVGDILLLEAGDMIAADGRIIENHSLQVNESSLTGESTNVNKSDVDICQHVVLADRINMVYSGTLVTYGRAKVLVTNTGMNTEIGKIACIMNNTKNRKTPLQVNLDNFGKKLAIVIVLISIFVFALRYYQGEKILDSLMFAVALAVAAIPEALSSIITIVQAMGTRKMAKENAIIKDLKAVESLGCVSIICSDKTGTLTQNKMTVKEIYIDGMVILPNKLDMNNHIHKQLIYSSVLDNDSSIQGNKQIGDPTEICLLEMLRNYPLKNSEINEEDIRNDIPRNEELPFDSDRKIMSTKHVINNIDTVYTKGAVDILIERMNGILTKNGVRNITDEDKKKILEMNIEFSQNGLRVLAFGYKEQKNEKLTLENEKDFTFIGLIAMIDPPRDESKEAVANAKNAGIKTVMITGDHKTTAVAIAKQIGIFNKGDCALTGIELDDMCQEKLEKKIDTISVYARVSPENKIRIVNAWQNKGKIVAMTGDGVNDAPALKKADIGVAMGITGTEVSKDAAAMILADDNFATIINAVLNGRNVYRNILNAILFLLSGNLAALITVLYCSLLALATPFEPVHLLFINLLTDSLPALAIGMEPYDKDLLKNKPRDSKAGILTKQFSLRLLMYGILIAISTIIAFQIGLKSGDRVASTMAFSTLTLARLFHGYSCRGDKSLKKIGIFKNKWTNRAFLMGIFLLIIVLFVPVMKKMFLVVSLSGFQIGCVVVLAIIPTIIIQIQRGVYADNKYF